MTGKFENDLWRAAVESTSTLTATLQDVVSSHAKMTSTSGISDMALQMSNQGQAIAASAAPVIHFQAIAQNMESLEVKDEKEDDKDNISSIIASSLQSVQDGPYVGPGIVVEKDDGSMSMGQAVVSCLQTIGGVTGTVNSEMDALGIVIEEVQIMEEVEWHQEEIPVIQFRQLCRVCAMETPNLIAIFGEEGSNLELADKIYWHLPIEVKEDDNLPLTICTSCVTSLNSWHDLATSSIEADEKLRKIFNITEPSVAGHKQMSNFASTRMSIYETLNTLGVCETAQDSVNKVTEIVPNERETKRPTIPTDQLSKAMEFLKKKDPQGSEEDKVQNNTITDQLPKEDYVREQQPEDDYLDGTHIKLSLPAHEDSITSENVEKSETSEFIDASVFPSGYTRPHRQIKRKFPEGCDIFLKSKIAGAMQDIMSKDDDDDKNCEARQKRRFRHKDWKCQTCGLAFGKKSLLIIHERRKSCSQNSSCSYCDKSFRNVMSMRIHERSHTKMIGDKTGPSSYMCEFCGKSFRGKKTLKEHHLANHSEVKPYKCDKCDKNYGSLTSLDIHKATHSTETPFLCDLCGKSFKHVSNLRSHKRSHMDESDKNKQVCDVCGKGFRSRFHLSEHMNVHTGRRPYACNVCGKNFHKKIQLRQHGSAHSGVQPFKCHLCGVPFNRRGNMTQHIKRHYRERKYTCRVCNEGFATLGAVLSHRKRHTKEEVENSIKHTNTVDDPEQVAYKCEVCGKLLAKKDSLAIHMRSHTGEKPFECGVCGKRLSNKGSLSYHMRSFHTGERPHTCQYCGEGFLSRESRLVHERIHTGEKPYICTNCGMAFRCSSNLAQHARVHSEARPHPCPHCEKRFQRKGALDVHIRTHTGERPFACDICGRCFTQKNDMLKHRKTHSPDRPTPCPHCGQMFTHKREFAKHQLLHIATTQAQVQQVEHVVEPTTTQTVLITTADNLITYPEINVPVMENAQTLILHRY